MSSATDKTLHRVHERIKNQEFYEAHQAVRTVVARYLRKKEYASAIGLLYSSAMLLSKAQQTGSASDLLLYLLKVYEDAQVPVDGASKGRIAQVVWYLDPNDAVLKQVANQTLNQWARGDADLSHVFGLQFLRGDQLGDAERFLLSGTRDSAELLAKAHAAWQKENKNSVVAGFFEARGVLGYLSVQSIRNAKIYLTTYIAADSNPRGEIHEFLDLLVTTCQTRDAQLYKKLVAHYRPGASVPGWDLAGPVIEKDYFGIVPPRQVNLMDMMSGFMK